MKEIHKKWLSASLVAVMAVSSACAAGVTAFAGYGEDYISAEPEFMQILFDGLSAGIKDIAAGKRISSIIWVDLPTPIPYDSAVDIHENCSVLEAILVEYPYELYWFDFTGTGGLEYEYYYIDSIDGQEYLTAVEYKLAFAQAYRGRNKYTADPEKIAQAAKAAENAKAIVEENKDKSDFEKLTAYKDKICELVTYDADAISDPSTPYGDPWQLVYVFDNDPETNVVCEGYSKAFQYLCDLTEFDDSTIRCAQITGEIIDGTGSDGHMWNIVTIGGKSYHVDVTNCDEKTVGEGDYLFLKGADAADETGCSFSVNRPGYVTAYPIYKYDEYTTEVFDSKLLTVSTEDYGVSVGESTEQEKPKLSGYCGDTATWGLYTNGNDGTYTLKIDGYGGMYSYEASEIPWKDYNEVITDIIVGADVTDMGSYLFVNPFETPVPADRKIKIVMAEDYSWIIDGSNLTSLENANIPSLYDNSLSTDSLRGTVGLKFSMEDTNLPTSLELVFNKSNAGKYANLYKSVDGELVFVDTVKVGEDGTVVLPNVSKMGDYAVMLCEYSDRPGDADNDGILTAKDASAILKHLVGIEECSNYDKADFNRDGFKDQRDAADILKNIVDTL